MGPLFKKSSPKKIAAYAKLQQILLHTDDSGNILTSLLAKTLEEYSSLGFTYHFISALFLDAQWNIKQTYFTDSNPDRAFQTENVFNLNNFFTSLQVREGLIAGQMMVFEQVDFFINPSYTEKPHLKSIIFSPIFASQKFIGTLIFGSSRKNNEILSEEREMIELITNLLSIAFKLHDSQKSLTNVTEEVYKMNLRLHQLDKLKDDFVSIASHELRTPMTAIRSYVWMALNRPDVVLTEKMKKYLSRTLLSTERLINLVNDMLNVSRIEAGKVEINPVPFDIVSLAKEVIDEVKPKADEKSLKLILSDGKMPQVFADPDKVHQVLLNLVGNATKFTPIDGSITISFFSDGISVEVSIKDTGQGISKEDLSKLFKKFERLDNSMTVNTVGGTGLGLFISKSLIDLMHGKIWASSEGSGTGTTFTFSLPVANVEILAHPEKYRIKAVGEAKPLEPVTI